MFLASARVRQRGVKVRQGCSESLDLTNPSSVVQLQSAIEVLRNALGKCKSEADRSESAIGVLKKCPKTLAITRGLKRPSRDIALRSPPIREAESAIGVLRNALGQCKSKAERSERAIGVLKTSPKTLAGTRGTRRAPRDIAVRSPPLERQKMR